MMHVNWEDYQLAVTIQYFNTGGNVRNHMFILDHVGQAEFLEWLADRNYALVYFESIVNLNEASFDFLEDEARRNNRFVEGEN